MNYFFFLKKIRELIEKNIPEDEASKLVMLYALKSVSKDSNRELTSLIQLLKSKKVAEHWIEVITHFQKDKLILLFSITNITFELWLIAIFSACT